MSEHIVAPTAVLRVTVPCVVADAVESEHPELLGDRSVVGRDHSAFAGSQVLGRIETEHAGVAGRGARSWSGADGAFVIKGAGGVRRVFDHIEAALPR